MGEGRGEGNNAFNQTMEIFMKAFRRLYFFGTRRNTLQTFNDISRGAAFGTYV
jgi:hypothetical protein